MCTTTDMSTMAGCGQSQSTTDRISVVVTLGQLLSLPELHLQVVSDPPGCRSAPVTIVHSSELPSVDQWLAGGEVLLTIGALQDLDSPDAADYIRRVHAAGAVALGIGLGEHLPNARAPEQLITHARAVGLPLFMVPEPVPFVAVVEAFTRLRESESAHEVSALVRTQRRFATALAARGTNALLAEISRALGAPVALASPTGRLLGTTERVAARQGLPGLLREELITAAAAGGTAPRLLRATAPEVVAGSDLEAIPVGSETVTGWLLTPVAGTRPGGDRHNSRTLLLATAAALLALQDTRLADRRELAAQLCTGLIGADELPERFADSTGFSLPAALSFAIAGGERAAEHSEESGANSRFDALLTDLSPGVFHHPTTSGTALICPPGLRGLVEAICRALGIPVTDWSDGTPDQVHDRWHEWRYGAGDRRSQLGQLLASVSREAAADFVQRTLGPLTAADDDGILMRTLEHFASAGGNRDAVAQALGVHRHTVRARLERIRQILGYDPREPGHLQAIGIAFLLRETTTAHR